MIRTVYTKTYSAMPFDKREILRYARVRTEGGMSAELCDMLDGCICEVSGKLTLRVCYCELPLQRKDGELDLGFARVASASLENRLYGCDSVVVFAATVGIELDRLIARYSSVSPTKALLLQAIGTERIESLCDAFCEELRQEKRESGFDTRPRFSPGYGDVPLEIQKNIFTLLDCHKRIGLSLCDSMLMSPSKSVTAIIGIENKEKNEDNRVYKTKRALS